MYKTSYMNTILSLTLYIWLSFFTNIPGNVHGLKHGNMNVLFIPVQIKSHIIFQQNIAEELQSRGHHVYFILGSQVGKLVEEKLHKSNISILWFEQQPGKMHGGQLDNYTAETILHQRGSRFNMVFTVRQIALDDCLSMWNDKQLISQFRTIQFDIAFVNPFDLCPCNCLIPYNFSIPFVMGIPTATPWHFGEASLPSVEPFPFFIYSDDMTFMQRCINLLASVFYYNRELVFFNESDRYLMSLYAPEFTSWVYLKRQALLSFIYRDSISGYPRTTLPNIITLPGISYSAAKPLPKAIEDLMLTFTDVILVSFGTMGGYMPEKHIRKLIDAFRRINQTVILSFAGSVAEYQPLPTNLHVLKWIPQNDLLGHVNTKLFITHAGHNSQMEAIYHAVPMIAIPLFADQPYNAFTIKNHGMGLTLDLFDFTANELVDAIHEILYNNHYSEKVKLRSNMLREMPGKHPVVITSDWIEYVSRNGADHLRSRAMDMPLYKSFMLDILMFIFIIIFVAFYITYVVCKRTYTCIINNLRKKVKVN